LADGGLIAIHSEITDHKNRELQVQKSKEDAELANRAKSDFLANMSHELRTPLNAIIGFSDVLEQKIFGEFANEKQAEYVTNIMKSGQHLLDLINDLLDLSTIESGHIELNETNASLAEIVAEAHKMVAVQAQEGGITLNNYVGSDAPEIRVDPLRLKQVMVNLLNNAVKFTPADGHVETGWAFGEDGSISIAVRDDGIGMSKEEIDVAKSRFGRVSADDTSIDGTGLGLPLAIEFVHAHGGNLEVDSAPNQGTAVTICLPEERVILETN
jgi:two-component system cell cycle sensor histidine kinase PleC